MKVVARAGREGIATVYVGRTEDGGYLEFVESTPPPFYDRKKKWVLIISSLYGCPVGCRFCDAGGYYQGKVAGDDILRQIDYLVERDFPDGRVDAEKFKIQFARIGEPSFNMDVLDVMERLHRRYDAPGLLLSLSTVAPVGTKRFFQRLLDIKKKIYPDRFQLQFSIHSTDPAARDWLMPVRKMSFGEIAEYGERFYDEGGKRITLNFAISSDTRLDSEKLLEFFDPGIFLIKVTPVNPTYMAKKNRLSSGEISKRWNEIVDYLSDAGYEVILSIGELEENKIGSNCGQHVMRHMKERDKIRDAYLYDFV